MMPRLVAAGSAALALALAAAGAYAPASERLAYYSDYFSFVGEDARGKVAFALDSNRGQDGAAFQAEHFVVLHDERTGWVPLRGNGAYPNPRGVLESIPDSADFAFKGAAEQGIVVTSARNALALEVAPVPRILVRRQGGGLFWVGAAAATLRWDGRVLPGRVIFEYLHRAGWNRLTRTYPRQWRDFHGLYLRVEGGGDLYLHRQAPAAEEPLTGTRIGFAVLGADTGVLNDIAMEVPSRSQALGLYRWPDGWRGGFRLGGSAYEFDWTLGPRKVIGNWVIGGFAMGVVQGELRRGAERRRVYGLAELIL